jgi:hypothetical protein
MASHHKWQEGVKRHWRSCTEDPGACAGPCAGDVRRAQSMNRVIRVTHAWTQRKPCRRPAVEEGKLCVRRAKPHGTRREKVSRQQANAAPATRGVLQRCPAGRQACRAVPAGRHDLAAAEHALLGLLCSAARRAPCALRASPAELTCTRLHAVQLVWHTAARRLAQKAVGAAQVQQPLPCISRYPSLPGRCTRLSSRQVGGSQLQGDNSGPMCTYWLCHVCYAAPWLVHGCVSGTEPPRPVVSPVLCSHHRPALLNRAFGSRRDAERSAPCPPACAPCTAAGALPGSRTKGALRSHLPHTSSSLDLPRIRTLHVSSRFAVICASEPACAPCPPACAPCTVVGALQESRTKTASRSHWPHTSDSLRSPETCAA